MPDDEAATKLGQRRYVTLVVRLLVDPRADIQGSVVDLHEKSIGQFRQLDRLPDLIRRWLNDAHALWGACDDLDHDRVH